MQNNSNFPMLGDYLPRSNVHTTTGNKTLPDDYKGKWLILFSHPGDFTPVCTTELVTFANHADDFKRLNAELMALSVDQSTSHLKWIEWMNNNMDTTINYPIISDPIGAYANKLGMIHPEMGQKTVRKLFIVDTNGKIRLTMTYPAQAGRSVSEVLRILDAIQISDKYKMAAPEGYPDSEVIKNSLLYPPPQTEQQAKTRIENKTAGGYECNDWWFCYKNMNNGFNNHTSIGSKFIKPQNKS